MDCCAGNGRPFAMEVLDPAVVAPTQQQLDAIRDAVNRGEGLNAEKDVEVAHLSLANRSLWENMQTKAEEKRKGYCCVVWTERGVSREELKNIEVLSRSGAMRDETGEACIEVISYSHSTFNSIACLLYCEIVYICGFS